MEGQWRVRGGAVEGQGGAVEGQGRVRGGAGEGQGIQMVDKENKKKKENML